MLLILNTEGFILASICIYINLKPVALGLTFHTQDQYFWKQVRNYVAWNNEMNLFHNISSGKNKITLAWILVLDSRLILHDKCLILYFTFHPIRNPLLKIIISKLLYQSFFMCIVFRIVFYKGYVIFMLKILSLEAVKFLH